MVFTRPPIPPKGILHEFLNTTPVKLRITTKNIVAIAANDKTLVTSPRLLSTFSETHSPRGINTKATSSFTDSASTTATQYQRHLLAKAAQIASATNVPSAASGWKFSRFVQPIAGCNKYTAAMTAASGSLRRRCRENQYTGSAPSATTTDCTMNSNEVVEKTQYSGTSNTKINDE